MSQESGHLTVPGATTWPGDSGGPSYTGGINSAQLVGVHSTTSGDVLVTSSTVRDWIASHLNGTWNGIYLGATDVPLAGEAARSPSDDAVDPDGDGLVDAHDNCPSVSNPDQADGDLDGLGDACDLCASAADRDFEDADGDGYNDLTCDRCPLFDAPGDGGPLDTDGDGISDACDICAYAPDRPGAPNCNRDAEIAEARPELPDACDPVPCPAGVTTSRPTELGAPPYVSTVESSMVTLVGRTEALGLLSADAEAGMRFCRCDDAEDDTVAARALCSSPLGFNCSLDPAEFSPPEPSAVWHTMSLTTSGPGCATHPYGDLRCMLDYQRGTPRDVDWDFTTDMTAWSVPFTPNPYSEEVHGVLWSHTEGAYTQCVPLLGCSGVSYDEPVASHYWSGAVRREPRLPVPGWRADTSFFPVLIAPEDCIPCRAMQRLAWMVGLSCLRTGSCGLTSGRTRYSGFDREADQLLESASPLATGIGYEWLGAADLAIAPPDRPLYLAMPIDASWLGGALRRNAQGLLTESKDYLASLPTLPVAGWPTGLASFQAVYRAADLTAFALGVPVGGDSAELDRFDLASSLVTPFALRLPSDQRIVDVLALGLRWQDETLFALVETAPASDVDGLPVPPAPPVIALAEIPLDGSDVTLTPLANPGTAQWDRHAILFDGLGRLVLVGWDLGGGYVAVRASMASLYTADGYRYGADALVAAPVYDETGISYVRDTGQDLEAAGFADGELDPSVPGNLSLGY